MAVLLTDVINGVWALMRERGLPLPDPDRIESVVDISIGTLADAASMDERRGYVQKDFTFAMVNGVVDLSSNATILIHTIKLVTHPTALQLSLVGNRSELDAPAGPFYYRAAVEDDKLYARHWDGISLPDDDDVTVQANFVPTLADLHAQLKDDLIREVVKHLLLKGQIDEEEAA